ncbi:DUF4136 domain-containing protein [Ascidiimonas aurantiaca]|uniref:DUF4136 domain-containing protein n=1 Tax=Ascidiimonas aurantiaca TaxID=1685432 RepID=UPI0030EB4B0A
MKAMRFILPLVAAMVLTSCASVRVATDFDRQVNFTEFKSFAFFKPGIDKAEISDLDKKRILRAIEAELTSKGFVKSEEPDLLVSIFTNEKERVDVWNNWGWGWGPGWGWGWGWGPGWGWGGNFSTVTTRTEGVLYIDIINAENKELVWQGKGTGYLTDNMEKKEARIREFVREILLQYPPQSLAQR